jgi:hypothetical protein
LIFSRNTLVDEALNLAYHGARARDQSFNVTLERDFDEAIPPITLVPQDITRVLLNLFSNGFYAAHRRQAMEATPDFEPTLMLATRELGDAVEIRVRDNGIGIPEEVKDKLFQPFFTTKPTGEAPDLVCRSAATTTLSRSSTAAALRSRARSASSASSRYDCLAARETATSIAPPSRRSLGGWSGTLAGLSITNGWRPTRHGLVQPGGNMATKRNARPWRHVIVGFVR